MDGFLKSLIPSASQDFVGWEDAPFLARLTSVYTPSSGAQNGQNQYAFIEQVFDPLTGFPKDATGGRRTFPQSGPFTTSYAVEANNTLLTVPGSTPTGYSNPGPYVQCKLKGLVSGAPVYEFSSPPVSITSLTATAATHSLTTSWANTGLSVSLPANSTWHVSATINGSIGSSSSSTTDSLSFRFYDGTTVWGAAIECCYAICSSITFVDDCALFAVVTVGGSPVTLSVQGIVNTSTGSTGSMLSSNYLTAIRLQ